MSLFLQAMLFDKYGVARLDLLQLAEAINMSKSTIVNQLSAGTFPIKTYLDGKRFADIRDVAEYLDEKRKEAV